MKNDNEHPSAIESLLAGLLMGIVGMSVMFYGFLQATGGL